MISSTSVIYERVFRMAGDVLQSGAALAGKKRRGKRFLSFCRDTLVGNPGDPLIGFPIVSNRRELPTENRELLLKKSQPRLPQMSLFAHRGQPLQIRYRFLHCDPITKGDNPA